jgi:hypothetical protein
MSDKYLTPKQKALLKELHKLADIFGLNYSDILSYEPEARTATLEVMKRQVIRGEVITWYTLFDELFTNAICRYFFGGKRSFPALWKTKRFQIFNYYVIEELYFLPKFRLVKAIRKIPKSASQDIEALNALRNAMAHSFFPENLRKTKPLWKGKDIFSVEGAELFKGDMIKLTDHFVGDID